MGLLRRVCILSSCSPTNGISRMGDFRESLLLFNYMSKLDWRRLYLWLQVKSSSWNCGVIVKAKPQQAMSESNLQGNDKAVVKSKATAFPAASSLLSHCSINQSLLNYLLQTKGCISMQVALRFMLANSPWPTTCCEVVDLWATLTQRGTSRKRSSNTGSLLAPGWHARHHPLKDS